MSFGRSKYPDPDDFFADTRMSFGDHLEELRLHLWRAIGGFLVALVLGFVVGYPLLRFICEPVETELQTYWDRYYDKKINSVMESVANGKDAGKPIAMRMTFSEQALKKMGLENRDLGPVTVDVEINDPLTLAAPLKRFETVVGRRPSLATMNVQEGFFVYIKVSMVAGLVLSSPWIFYQIWSFIAAGLYPHEKRHVNVFLPVSIGLFLAGVALCQFFVIPKAISALLWFNEWLELEPEFRQLKIPVSQHL